MSSAMDLLNNKGTFLGDRTVRRTSKLFSNRSWREESPKRSRSRSRPSSQTVIQVRIKKMEKSKIKTQAQIKDKILRKKTNTRKAPTTPHNTTQYLIDANQTCAETPNIYGEDHDQFQYSFNHHPMAGSMMSMMSSFCMPSGFPNNELGFLGASTEISSNSEEVAEIERDTQENRLVNSITREDSDIGQDRNEYGDYSQYLRQSETGEDLQEVVRSLVEILRQKDQQIQDMKSMVSN